MADDNGTRLRNTSPYGDVDVPDIGTIVPFHHEIVVADEDVAARLVESGHFTVVAKPGPKTADTAPPSAPQTTDELPAAAGSAQPTSTGDTE